MSNSGGRSNTISQSHSPQNRTNNRNKNCWFCNKEEHIKQFCPERKKGNDGSSEKSDSINISNGYESGDVLAVSVNGTKGDWVLDSCCTFHMTSRRDQFIKFKQFDGGKMLLGDDTMCEITSIGFVWFKMWNGIFKTLEDVRLVPKLWRNLISLELLTQRDVPLNLRRES